MDCLEGVELSPLSSLLILFLLALVNDCTKQLLFAVAHVAVAKTSHSENNLAAVLLLKSKVCLDDQSRLTCANYA